VNPFVNRMHAMHSIFNDDFMDIYQEIEPKARRRVLPYVQSIYRRWYHSTFIENIHFSPANIVDTIGNYCGTPAGTYIVAAIGASVSKVEKIDMKMLNYSLGAHPITADIKVLIDTCTPHIDLCEEWCFSDAQAIKVAKKLSLYDPYYASFLLEVACKLGLLTRMPSLYVQRMQVSQTANKILGLSNTELLQRIVDAVIEMTAVGLQNTLPATVPLFTEEGLRNLLANPLSTDEIFEQAFGALGYDLNLLSLSGIFSELDGFSDESESAAELMSGIFVLGVMLDRLFFTPFGYFLRLIRPIYSMPFNIEAEIAQYALAFDDMEDDFAAFFAPCTSYTLTELGLDLLEIEPTENNFFDSHMLLPPDVLDITFNSPERIRSFIQAARESIPLSEMPNAIYTFCVYETDDPDAWVHIQIPKMYTLHQLYEEILQAFYADEKNAYSFFHSKIENQFAEYTGGTEIERFKKLSNGRRNAKPFKKHTHVSLSMLDFRHIGHLLLVLTGAGVQKFTVEWLGESAPNPQEYYPKVSKLSAAAQELRDSFDDIDEEFLDFFDPEDFEFW